MRLVNRALASASFVLVGLASQSAFGNVLTVAPLGANYTQIQAAVNAASDGDVILISPGVYVAHVTIDGKSLTLCNKGGGDVTTYGRTTVRNLTASQRVIISGVKNTGSSGASFNPDDGLALLIENNAGNVRVEYCSFVGAIGGHDFFGSVTGCCNSPSQISSGRNGATLRNNSGGVSFTACELRGGRGAHFNWVSCYCGQAWSGGDGLTVQSTLVSLYDSICTGGSGGEANISGNGGVGCRTASGTSSTGCFASGSTFSGGAGGNGWDVNSVGGSGGNGIQVGPSTGVHLLDNTYVGGGIGYGFQSGTPGAPIAGSGSIFYETESKLVMTTDRVARAGSVVDVSIQGAPGQDMYLIVSRAPTFQILPSWRGTLLSQQGKGSVVVRVGRIPSSGVLLTRYLVPPLPAGVTSSTVFIQAVRSDMAAGPKLAAGTSITLLQ